MNQKFLRIGSGAIYYLNACSCVGVGLDVFISGMDSRLYNTNEIFRIMGRWFLTLFHFKS
jgi:hypothetical protein